MLLLVFTLIVAGWFVVGAMLIMSKTMSTPAPLAEEYRAGGGVAKAGGPEVLGGQGAAGGRNTPGNPLSNLNVTMPLLMPTAGKQPPPAQVPIPPRPETVQPTEVLIQPRPETDAVQPPPWNVGTMWPDPKRPTTSRPPPPPPPPEDIFVLGTSPRTTPRIPGGVKPVDTPAATWAPVTDAPPTTPPPTTLPPPEVPPGETQPPPVQVVWVKPPPPPPPEYREDVWVNYWVTKEVNVYILPYRYIVNNIPVWRRDLVPKGYHPYGFPPIVAGLFDDLDVYLPGANDTRRWRPPYVGWVSPYPGMVPLYPGYVPPYEGYVSPIPGYVPEPVYEIIDFLGYYTLKKYTAPTSREEPVIDTYAIPRGDPCPATHKKYCDAYDMPGRCRCSIYGGVDEPSNQYVMRTRKVPSP